eukprot:8493727-Pyramimonas_sp.AAC.1
MTWLHRASLPCASLPAPAGDLAAGEQYILHSATTWKHSIRVGLQAAANHHSRVTLAAHMEKSFFDAAAEAGVPRRIYTDERGLRLTPPAPPPVFHMRCPWCGAAFSRMRALRAHI